MTRHHVPYSELKSTHYAPSVEAAHDVRHPANAPRVLWHTALKNDDRGVYLESEIQSGSGRTRGVTRMSARRYGAGWEATPAAFDPLEASRGTWLRLLVRDAPVVLGSFRPFEPPMDRLQELGLPEDVGSNGWIATDFEDRLLIMPSLTLMIALAIPSDQVWQRLKHPLSMDLSSWRSDVDPAWLEIQRDPTLGGFLNFSARSLATLAFWMESHRLRSLHRALEGFNRPAWTAVFPDRPETLNLAFDAYQCRGLIVVQRLRVSHGDCFFPRDWERIRFLDGQGRVRAAVTPQDFVDRIGALRAEIEMNKRRNA